MEGQPTKIQPEVKAPGPNPPDQVNHPEHYNKGGQEIIDIIEDQVHFVDGYKGFLMGNIIKYVCRHPHKGSPKLDLQKAEFYLKKLIVVYGRTPKAT